MGSSNERRVEPELLDHLPPESPLAIGSRNDLTRVNKCMGNAGILARAWLRHCPAARPKQIVDLGGGDGSFLARLALRLKDSWAGATLTLVDVNLTVASPLLDAA